MKITLKHIDYCDGCSELKALSTLGGHKRCEVYKTILLPTADIELVSKGQGTIVRSDKCKELNEVEIKKGI